jgi:hypothetical protein
VSPDALIFSEMLLVLGLVLGFGFWELWKLRRDKKKPPPRSNEPS